MAAEPPADQPASVPLPVNPAYYTRSQKLVYKAAGVLPIALHLGEPHVLLGYEPSRTGPGGSYTKSMWKDFGGRREAGDVDVAATAGREFSEETLGLFSSCSVNSESVRLSTLQMTAQLRRRELVREVVQQLREGSYHLFFVRTAYIDSFTFQLATQENQHSEAVKDAEKTAYCWVRLKDLLRATSRLLPRYYLRIPWRLLGVRRDGIRNMQLHPAFARTMRLAQAAGLASLVQEMRKESRAERPFCHQLLAASRAASSERPAAAQLSDSPTSEAPALAADDELASLLAASRAASSEWQAAAQLSDSPASEAPAPAEDDELASLLPVPTGSQEHALVSAAAS